LVAAMGNTGHSTSWTLHVPPGPYYWSVQAIDAGYAGSPFATETEVTGVGDDAGALPRAFALLGATPNPSTGTTRIRFDLPKPSDVRIDLFDVTGRLVRTLLDERELPAGTWEAAWDGRGRNGAPTAAGIYFYRMRAARFREARKLVLIR